MNLLIGNRSDITAPITATANGGTRITVRGVGTLSNQVLSDGKLLNTITYEARDNLTAKGINGNTARAAMASLREFSHITTGKNAELANLVDSITTVNKSYYREQLVTETGYSWAYLLGVVLSAVPPTDLVILRESP